MAQSGMKLLFLDSETCGLYGMPVLFQYAEDDGPIILYDIWCKPIHETLSLIEWFCEHAIVFFNGSYDWFHACKLYTVFNLCDPNWLPEDHINEIALLEPRGQDGPCLKPASSCDLFLWSRKNEYQALMARGDVRIRRVPAALAPALAAELENRVEINGIFFAGYGDPNAPRWKVYDIHKEGHLDMDFKDVVLNFNPAGGLKFLAEFAMGHKPKYHYQDVELDRSHSPIEYGYAPTALKVSTPEQNWEVKEGNEVVGYAWPAVIKKHICHWATNEPAREYARDDVVYTRELYDHFGRPEPGDDDSVLACMVAAVRWHGYKIDVEGMKELRTQAKSIVDAAPININATSQVRAYLAECLDATEVLVIKDTTDKKRLTEIAALHIEEDEPCTKCMSVGCVRCNHTGVLSIGLHPAALRAKELLAIKTAAKEVELYNKLLLAGKFHASFRVIGTLSSRMSGGDGLNPQGIKKSKEVRKKFPLAWNGYTLCGGDFDSFEITLADAVYNDDKLREALLCGKKIHGLFGVEVFPGQTYEQILASDGSSDLDMYTIAKSCVFAMLYGGTADTLSNRYSITKEVAIRAYEGWGRRFPGIAKARVRVYDAFCSMRQPDGIGSAVEWTDPSEYVESFLGDRRYFTLENRICKELFNLARNTPKEWKDSAIKVVRRDRVQTGAGAVSSALYGAAFSLQQANMRAAANHEIQSPGARITKYVQRKIWDVQPSGVHPFRVCVMNVHDELLCVTHPDYVDQVAEVVRESVEHFRPQVPLIAMKWNYTMQNWAEKKAGGRSIHIKAS
jgi:hypothetical protein